ncbi:MAG TPA: alpha/beta hydrolase [Dongiaceae bacterium]|nr:alpha/beta hydrolase [Dongiaceae bacterium]
MSDPEIDALRAAIAANPRPPGVAERRQRLDAIAGQQALDPAVRLEAVAANGVGAEWATGPGADPARAILYIHGGGYISGSIVSHRGLAVAIGRAAGSRVLSLDYRRAPEDRFPAAVEDVVAAYRFLLDQGFAPSRIAVAGDSAGGGLTLALMLAARERGLPLPACGWCISPWVDLLCGSASMTSKAAVDPIIQKPYLLEIAGLYLGEVDPRTPLASPLYGDLRGLPPLLIQVGSAEVLLDDSIMLAGIAGGADVTVTLEVWPEMIHAWPLFQDHLAGGRKATARAGAYIREMTA